MFFIVHPLITPPYELIMTEYSKYKGDRQNWFSPPFYSGPRGYKMCLCVEYHGSFFHKDCMPVCVYLMRGEYDDRLVWPFHGEITVQLVNQSSNQKYHEGTLEFNYKSLISSCSRVTSGERAESGCVLCVFILDSKNTMCVKDDCVKFRVTKVSVTS